MGAGAVASHRSPHRSPSRGGLSYQGQGSPDQGQGSPDQGQGSPDQVRRALVYAGQPLLQPPAITLNWDNGEGPMPLLSSEISTKSMVPLCRQLATSYQAGIPIVRGLGLVAVVPR